MFYNAHAHIASRLFKSKNNLLIVGSFLPDIAITKIFEWNSGLHGKENAYAFMDFLKKEEEMFEFLGKGVLAHCIVDDYSHHDYAGGSGYSYQNNQKLASLIKGYYELDDKMSYKKAHNFIESGVDMCLLRDFPDMQKEIINALQNTDVSKISQVLSSYFNLDKEKIYKACNLYFETITRHDLTKKEGWILFWKDLNKLMELKDIDNAKINTLLDEGLSIVKDTYKDYLDYCVSDGARFVNK